MTKMEQFVAAMAEAMRLSTELGDEGISSINFRLTYHGTADAVKEIRDMIYSIETDGITHNKEVA